MRKESLAWLLSAIFSIVAYSIPADMPIVDKLLLILTGLDLAMAFITEVFVDEDSLFK